MAIGVLLALVAIVLAVETKSLLIGESAAAEVETQIVAALEAVDEVDRVIHLRTLHLGPEELLVAAKIAVAHDDTAGRGGHGHRRRGAAHPRRRADGPRTSTSSPTSTAPG